MEKTNNGMPPLNNDATEKQAPPHPAVIEAERLRKELIDERIKTEALSRRCIRLGEALDAAILAEEERAEKKMFDHINGNCYHRKAVAVASKRRKAHDKKMIEAFEDACTKNAVALCTSAVIGVGAIILGFAGFIHVALAAIIAGGASMAFGWALNDCVYLLGRCSK